MATLFSDAFATLSGTNWTQEQGTWSATSNQLRVTAVNAYREIRTTTSAHAAVANCKASITRRTSSASFDAGVIVRQSGSGATTSGYYLDAYSGNTVELFRRVAGVDTSLGSRTTTLANGDVYTLEVSGTGATVTLKAYKNGVQLGADFTDTNAARIVAAGQAGVIAWANIIHDFDDFLLEDLAGGGGGGGKPFLYQRRRRAA